MSGSRRGLGDAFRGVPLADAGDDVAPLSPAPVTAVARAVRRSWRWWMMLPLALAIAGVMALIPVDGVLTHPDVLVDLATALDVDLPPERARDAEASGTWLVPRREAGTPSVLQLAIAALPGGIEVVEAGSDEVDGFTPVASAMLMGAGVTPGRSTMESLQISAEVDGSAGIHQSQLGVGLALFDSISGTDIGQGRRILALGAVRADGTLTCDADPARSVMAAGPDLDVLVVSQACPRVEVPGVLVVQAVSVADGAGKVLRS